MIKDAKIIGICGRRGSGKSTRAKELIRDERRVIVYDPLYEYDKEGCSVVHSMKELLIAIKKGWNTGYRLAYQPDIGTDHVENVAKLCDILLKVQQPYKDEVVSDKVTLLIEEMSLSVPNQQNPKLRTFLATCNIGRHYGINIIGVTQRLAEISTTFRGNASDFYYYGLADATDIDQASKKIGKENAEMLISAQPHCGLYFNNGTVTAIKNKLL